MAIMIMQLITFNIGEGQDDSAASQLLRYVSGESPIVKLMTQASSNESSGRYGQWISYNQRLMQKVCLVLVVIVIVNPSFLIQRQNENLWSFLSKNQHYNIRGGVADWSHSAHDREVVGLNLVGTTFHKPTVNSAVHPSEVGK